MYKLQSLWPEINISPSAMYKRFQITFFLKVFVISAMTARWLAAGFYFSHVLMSIYHLALWRHHHSASATPVENPTMTWVVMFWLGLSWKPVALASRILRPSHRGLLWPGFGLAWPEPWLMRWQCDIFYVLQGDKPRAPKNTGSALL